MADRICKADFESVDGERTIQMEVMGTRIGKYSVKIKICGIKRIEDIRYVNEAKPDFAGFIVDHPKSHRSISPQQLKVLTEALDDDIISVGVFVDADPELIAGLYNEGVIDMIQLHGSEDDGYIKKLKGMIRSDRHSGQAYTGPVIKAFAVRSVQDLEKAQKCMADHILLDQGKGSGTTFDWSLVAENRDRITRPFFLAGGLDAGNIPDAVRLMQPWALDLSSSVETDKIKDREKIMQVMRTVRSL